MSTGFFTANNLHKQKLEKEKFEKEKEEAKKLIEKRLMLRTAIMPKKEPHQHMEGFLGKVNHLNDLNPHSLVGNFITKLFFTLLEAAFGTHFLIQKRDYRNALAMDAQKEARIKSGQEIDDGLRVAYQQKRNPDGSLMFDANGKPVFPAVYYMDANGQINYNRKPNTDGTADRASIRANGFVPKEDLLDAYMTLKDEYLEYLKGARGFTPEQLLRLNMELQKHEETHKKDLLADRMVTTPGTTPAPAARPTAKV